MGENSKIAWTHHSFNPWTGCARVSAECTNCYAETIRTRFGHGDEWGKNGNRPRTSAAYWRKPHKWNRDAAAAGERRRVFCASMADVYEDRPDLVPTRYDLFDLIYNTPNLDWLLLTKRPNEINRLTPGATLLCRSCGWQDEENCEDHRLDDWEILDLPPNVWLGTSVGHQQTISRAEYLVEHLTASPPVRFVSVEPMLGPVDLAPYLDPHNGINWVICGGESGPGHRPIEKAWVRDIFEQCREANVPFFFKQWGGNTPDAGGHLLGGQVIQEFPKVRR